MPGDDLVQAALDLQDGMSLLLAHGHGYTEILSWTWEQIAFAVQGVMEVELDRLDTLIRHMAPLVGAKLQEAPTAREVRHREVLEDMRSKRAAENADYQRRAIEEALKDLFESGFEVEEKK